MGLPEVAEFARNFAVMVRVQGPDPKGMKMRNQAFHHYSSGKTTLSASGMLLQGSSGRAASGSGSDLKLPESVLVLTSASVIEPFVLQQYRGKNSSKDKPRLIPGVQMHILLEGKSMTEGNMEALPWVPAKLLKLVNIPQSSAAVQSLIEASCGSFENGWEVGWSLASHSRGPQQIIDSSREKVEQSSFQSQWPISRTESSDPGLLGRSVTRIALLEIPSEFSVNVLKFQTSIPKRGDSLLAMGSPFGLLSPLHFLNNISVGSIGNSYPVSSTTRSLLMADIRCLPGMEGSPVFNEKAQFVGILTRPLRQKISGTEIQLVIPWEAIACVCSDVLQVEPHSSKGINSITIGNMLSKGQSKEFLDHSHEHICSDSNSSPVEKATASICLITTDDGSWASGVLLNKQGLVLTNAHLLEPWRFGRTVANGDRNETKSEVAIIPSKESVCMKLEAYNGDKPIHRKTRVCLDFMDPWMWTDASIVYISKGPLDIALLQLEIAPDQLCPIVMDVDCPCPGSMAYVIGHGLFGPRCDFLPSACLGVIAKVIEAKRSPEIRSNNLNISEKFPAMLETTAAVHPGSSGGAVVNSNGHMIGLVTSNAKHGGGRVIPHLNFSIPCAALEPILKFSKDMQDCSILEELDKPNEHLSSVWALMPPLYPKPELLPDVPQFVVEDNNKDIKGSRFAKFIAERKELMTPKTQNCHDRKFVNELIPSKL